LCNKDAIEKNSSACRRSNQEGSWKCVKIWLLILDTARKHRVKTENRGRRGDSIGGYSLVGSEGVSDAGIHAHATCWET
ncbi:unnamed protein product, partial [Ectocarpus sp. 6 AP-2014]